MQAESSFQQSINSYRVKFLSPTVKYWVRRYGLTHWYRLLSLFGFGLSYLLPKRVGTVARPIFIVGCSRSGTSLFVSLFAQHKQIANWSEAAQVLELNYYDPTNVHIKAGIDASNWELRRLQTLFACFTRLQGKTRFVNKHPENSLRIPFLKTIFPDAIFVHIVRDGHAVVRSSYLMRAKEPYRQQFPLGLFPKPNNWKTHEHLSIIEQFAHQWQTIVETIQYQAESLLDDKSYIEIKYDAFCEDVHATLKELDEFCDLSSSQRLYDAIPETVNLQDYKWKSDFSEAQIELINRIIGGETQ